jgi:ankyrin repeat protein
MNCADFDDFPERIERGSSRVDAREAIKRILVGNPVLASCADSDGTTALMVLSEFGPAWLVRALCELGADVDKVSLLGKTALINAIRAAAFGQSRDDVPAARILLGHGANPDLIAWDGCSALHQAIIYSQVVLVKMLLDHGADTSARFVDPPSTENALELARSGRVRGTDAEKFEIIQLLMQASMNRQ